MRARSQEGHGRRNGGQESALGTVPKATLADGAAAAARAGAADFATRAGSANDATNATNATRLEGNPASAFAPAGCPAGMIEVGATCIDRYEASVWSQPTGGTQYGAGSDDYPCDDNGQDCKGKIFARSVAGVTPSSRITWFQAQQALANSGKRLPSNAEWQAAVAGTPDSTVCSVSTGGVQSAGANAGCVSAWGVNDMVGNLGEWVADWVPASTACPGWSGFSDDSMCLSGASSTTTSPGALVRGGFFFNGTGAGPFAVSANGQPPSVSFSPVGFRGAR